VTAKIAGIPYESTFVEVLPFLGLITALTLAVAYWPDLSMWLPRILGYIH
jgi:TRAP-type C4-dicarboxylate transport system permease large subunit